MAKISNSFQVQIIDHETLFAGDTVAEQRAPTEWGHGVLSNIHYLSDNGNGNP